MAEQVNIQRIVKKLKENLHGPLFTQIYKDLNLQDVHFLAAVKLCAQRNWKTVFVKLIEMEYSNHTLVTQAFKTMMQVGKELWIQSVIKQVTPPKNDDGAEIFLCYCVAESVCEYPTSGFRLLSRCPHSHHAYNHCLLSCVLQLFLTMSLVKTDIQARLQHLDQWLSNRVNSVRGICNPTRIDCFHFKVEVSSQEVETRVDWCLSKKLHCVAMYMLFLHQDFEGIARFISNYSSDIGEFPRFLLKLCLHPAVNNNELNVTLALFDLYNRKNRTYYLLRVFRSSYCSVDWNTKRRALISKCQQKGFLVWALHLLTWAKDWEGVLRQAQSCGNLVLVDRTILKLHTYSGSWAVMSQLLDLSSRNSHVVAIILLKAIQKADTSMLSKLLDGDYEIDPNAIFCWWPFYSLNTITDVVRRPDREDTAVRMAHILIEKGLLYRFCSWVERHHLDQCMVRRCHGCWRCTVDYFEEALEYNMHRLLKLLLTSGSVPPRTIHRTVQNTDKMTSLRKNSTECASLLFTFSGRCRSLQNLAAFIISREVNVFPRNRQRRSKRLDNTQDLSERKKRKIQSPMITTVET